MTNLATLGTVGNLIKLEGETPVPSNTVSATTFDGIMDNVVSAFPIETITGIMGSIVSKGAPYALLYWGARKAVKAIFSAVKKGRIRV